MVSLTVAKMDVRFVDFFKEMVQKKVLNNIHPLTILTVDGLLMLLRNSLRNSLQFLN